MAIDILATRHDWLLTAARVVLGGVFFAHGAQKALGWFGGQGLEGTLRTMHDYLGLSTPLALCAIAAEFLGGIGLITGTLGRLAAAAIAVNMVVAIATVHARYGLFMNWTGTAKGEGYEYHLLAIMLASVIVLRGSGAASVDRLIAGM